MRAMQIIEWGKPLETREYPDPEPKGEEVLLRVEAAGVCHSDVHIWDGYFDLGDERRISLESRGVHLPFTMGHEIAGEVAALGPRASGVEVGDKGEEPADEPQLKALLSPYPADDMICRPVSARVGNVRNNDSSLIEPVAAA